MSGDSGTIILYEDQASLKTKATDLANELNSISTAQSLATYSPNTATRVKKVILFLSTYSPKADNALETCFLALAPEGELVVKLCSSEGGAKEEGGRDGGAMMMQLLLAGFVDVEALPASASSSASLIARKPKWEVGATASVSLPTYSSLPAPTSSSTSARPIASTWRVTDVEGEEDEDGGEGELIDPDSLLENDDGLLAAAVAKKAAKAKENGGAGCETKKRACKNCSCGRAEMEENGKEGGVVLPVMTEEELKESVSSCGNCYKGDAFRCGGCPYLGKPAFEPGQEKLIIKLD